MNQNLFIVFVLTLLSYLIEGYFTTKRYYKDRLIDYFIVRVFIIILCYNCFFYIYQESNQILNITYLNDIIQKKIEFSDIINVVENSYEYQFYVILFLSSIFILIIDIFSKINKFLDYYRCIETNNIKEVKFIEVIQK